MLDDLMNANLQHLRSQVQNLQVDDYIKGTKSFCDLESYKVKNSLPRAGSHDGTVGLKKAAGDMSVRDLPIKVLDRLIANEQKRYDGFTVYNRGEDLKHCLIDQSKLK